jgi:four helix bundle protein
MPFLALDLSLDLIRGLRPTIELLRRKSPRLRRQLENSLAGIVQNVCEGSGRSGGDRPALYRYALGSLREVNGILLAAVAFGWLPEAPLAPERDRLGGILFGLQRG